MTTQSNENAHRATRILSREAILQTMEFGDYVDAVEGAFRRLAEGSVVLPDVVHLPADGGAFHVKSAGLTGEPGYVAVKVNGNFPDNRERNALPTIQGVITLCDAANGFPLAVLDSTEVTTMRTGAATAVVARYLANPDSRVATIIGCGIQGRVQLQALHHELPLVQVYAFDSDSSLCSVYAKEMSALLDIPVTPVDDFAQGSRISQVVVTCTSSRNGFLGREHLSPGCLVAAVGADNDDKQELQAALLPESSVVVDSLDQCAHIGELHHALQTGLMERSAVAADLAGVVSGAQSGRSSPQDIVVFDSTGMAIQDVAAAAIIYERACARDLGVPIVLA